MKAAGVFCQLLWGTDNTRTTLCNIKYWAIDPEWPWSFPAGAVVGEDMVSCSAPCCGMVDFMPTWMHQITVHKFGYVWVGRWTCRAQREAKLTDYVLQFHISSWVLPLSGLHDYYSVLFMSIKTGLDIIPPTASKMQTSSATVYDSWHNFLCVSLPRRVLCDTSPQGEASQYSATGGRLRDQKGVLPLPWTVSSDVWWAGGKGSLLVFAVARARWTVCVDYTLVGMSCYSLRPGRYENSSELHSFGIQIWLLASCSILIGMCSWGIWYISMDMLNVRYSSRPGLGNLVRKKMIKHKGNVWGNDCNHFPLTGGVCYVIFSKRFILRTM